MENTLESILAKTTVGDIPHTPKGKIIEIESTCTLEEAFDILAKGGVLSAPVWDVENKAYSGFLDMRDLVSSVVFIANQNGTEKTKTLADLFVNAKWVGGAFTVTYLSRRNAFKPVKETDTLQTLVTALSKKGPIRMKRVPVIGSEGRVINVISQSTLVAFISKNLSNWDLADQSVLELKIGSSPVVSVEFDKPAIEAFKIMDSNQITGLAITKHGKLVGNISSRDLKLFIKFVDFDLLNGTIFEFVKTLRQKSIDIKSPTITVFGDVKLGVAVGKLAATKVHRIFVVDSEQSFHPITVISLVDVLSLLFRK